MHHETTLNLPTLSSKERDRQWLAAKLAEAGVVQATEVPVEPRPLLSKQWTAADMTIITTARRQEQADKACRKSGRPQGSVVEDTPELIARARAMAGLGVAKSTAAKRLSIGTDRLARLAEKHGIQFPTKAA